MNDEVGVGVLYRAQDLAKKIETRRNREAVVVAVRGQLRSGDVLEREVGQALGINPRVVGEPSDR